MIRTILNDSFNAMSGRVVALAAVSYVPLNLVSAALETSDHFLWSMPPTFVAWTLAFAAVAIHLDRGVLGVRAFCRAIASVQIPLIVIVTIWSAAVVGGLVLVVVPGLLALTRWALVFPVAVRERPRIFETFSRSNDLVRGSSWSVLVLVAGQAVIWFLAFYAITRLAQALLPELLAVWATTVVVDLVVSVFGMVMLLSLHRRLAQTPPLSDGSRLPP